MIPSIPGFVRSFVVFAISVWIVFSDRNFTHRDRKVRKGQFGLDDPFDSVVLRSFGFFAISVWIVFSDRNFTHRDRKVRKGQFGLADPFDSVVLRFFATSVRNRRFASRLLGDGLGRYRSLMKDHQN
jgi:hypothetical protein